MLSNAVVVRDWHVVWHPTRSCFTAFKDPAAAQELANRLMVRTGKAVRPVQQANLPVL